MSEFSDLGLMAAREAARSHLADHLVQARTAHQALMARLHRFLVEHEKAMTIDRGGDPAWPCIACKAWVDLGSPHAPDCEWVALVAMTRLQDG